MFSRYFLSLCIIVMFTGFVLQANAQEEPPEDQDVEARNPIAVRVVLKLLQEGIKWAAKHCLQQAAEKCKHLWKKPKEAFNCGKKFLEANKGRCAVGK